MLFGRPVGQAGVGVPGTVRPHLVRVGRGGDSSSRAHALARARRCLFEVFVAISNGVRMTVQLGAADARDFRSALNKGGMARVQKALEAIDARDAAASVQSDLDMILGQIADKTGMVSFNERVRGALLAEFKRISGAGLR